MRRIHGVEELQIHCLPAFLLKLHPVPQRLRLRENSGCPVQVVQYFGAFPVRRRQPVEGLKLRLQIRQH